jgi:hypothetical protein
LNYDALLRDVPVQNTRLDFAWKAIDLNIKLNFRDPNLDSFMEIWEACVSDEQKFTLLRRAIMKASLFMPPLYVGKAKSLYQRCHQHLTGRDKENNFHNRFTTFAKKYNVIFNKVSNLIFVCIRTDEESQMADEAYIDNFEGLVEEIIKYLSKPLYSIR